MVNENPIGSLTIQDTGKLEVGGAVTETHIVNNGTAITFPDVEVTFGYSIMHSSETPPCKKISNGDAKAYAWDDVDVQGINLPKWSIRCVLDMSDDSHVTLYGQILDLARTKGYKILAGSLMATRYTDAGANAHQLFTSVPTINVRIIQVNMKTSKNPNIVDCSIECLQDKEA
jgi:hypothetical protein